MINSSIGWVSYEPVSKAKSYNLAIPISEPAAPTAPASTTLFVPVAGLATWGKVLESFGLFSDPTLSLLKLIVLLLLNPKVGDPVTLLSSNEGPNPKFTRLIL